MKKLSQTWKQQKTSGAMNPSKNVAAMDTPPEMQTSTRKRLGRFPVVQKTKIGGKNEHAAHAVPAESNRNRATKAANNLKENERKQEYCVSSSTMYPESTFSCSFNIFDPELLSVVDGGQSKETPHSETSIVSKKPNHQPLVNTNDCKPEKSSIKRNPPHAANKENEHRTDRKRKSNDVALNKNSSEEKSSVEVNVTMGCKADTETSVSHSKTKQNKVQANASVMKSLIAPESPMEEITANVLCSDSQSPELCSREPVVRDSQCDLLNRQPTSSARQERSADVVAEISGPDSDRTFTSDKLMLSAWGLPDVVLKQYEKCGIKQMFEWQAECLCLGRVLNGGNLVYSAPTSAGKTLVAELLILKRVMETKRKAIVILPFVSVTREKMFYFQQLFQDVGLRVSGFMGNHRPAGGFKNVDVAVCTIEKGNSLINRLMEEDNLHKIGIIVVDELHMIGDTHRGYLLELLLTKIRYVLNKKQEEATKKGSGDESDFAIQIVGMSATLPNLDLLSTWLSADLYHTDFRPVPLTECVKIGTTVYDSEFNMLREVDVSLNLKQDDDHIIPLCLETITGGHSILIFCPTKNWCEKLSETIAREFYNILTGQRPVKTNDGFVKASEIIRLPLDRDALRGVVEQLRRTPAGLDSVLGRTVYYGVAYHHAGLTFDERDIVEGSFRQGIIRVLVATSTLSSGVNLPARRVIIRSPTFHGKIIDTLTYKQMIGRAGRKGVDTAGESILVCKQNERNKAMTLMKSTLPAVKSCLIKDEEELCSSLKRAILEIVVSGVAASPKDVSTYTSCTMLAASFASNAGKMKNLIDSGISFLQDNEFVSLKSVKNDDGNTEEKFYPTQLGSAVLASSLSPDEGLIVFAEFQKARKCFVLENELHIIYLVTPIYMQDVSANIDWFQYYSLWENLSSDQKRVAELVGVRESFLTRAVGGRILTKTDAQYKSVAIHRRFYTALVLNDLVNEVSLMQVAQKYGCNKGQLQSLQQSAATFAGMVTVFCAKLGWSCLELLLAQFQDRLTFGIQRELCDLIRISFLTGQTARTLYNAGYQTVAELACADPHDLEAVLSNSSPFQSNKKQDNESEWEAAERKKIRCIWLAGRKGVTEFEAAEALINSAKEIIQDELGVAGVKWHNENEESSLDDSSFTNTTTDISTADSSISFQKVKKRKIITGASRIKLNRTVKSTPDASLNSTRNSVLNASVKLGDSSFVINPFNTIKKPHASHSSNDDQICAVPCAQAQGTAQISSSGNKKMPKSSLIRNDNKICHPSQPEQQKETNRRSVQDFLCAKLPTNDDAGSRQDIVVDAEVHRQTLSKISIPEKVESRSGIDVKGADMLGSCQASKTQNSLINLPHAETAQHSAEKCQGQLSPSDQDRSKRISLAVINQRNVQYNGPSQSGNKLNEIQPEKSENPKSKTAIESSFLQSPLNSTEYGFIEVDEINLNDNLDQNVNNSNEISFDTDCSDSDFQMLTLPSQNTDKSFVAILKDGATDVNSCKESTTADAVEKKTEDGQNDENFELHLSPSCDNEIVVCNGDLKRCDNENPERTCKVSHNNLSDEFLESFIIDTQTAALIGASEKNSNNADKIFSNNIKEDDRYLCSSKLFSENMFSDESAESEEKLVNCLQVLKKVSPRNQKILGKSERPEADDNDESFNLVPASNYDRMFYNEESSLVEDDLNVGNLDSSYSDFRTPYLTGQQSNYKNKQDDLLQDRLSPSEELHDDIAIALNMSDSFSIENLPVMSDIKNKSRNQCSQSTKSKFDGGKCIQPLNSTPNIEGHMLKGASCIHKMNAANSSQHGSLNDLSVDHFSSPFSFKQVDALLRDCDLQVPKTYNQERSKETNKNLKTQTPDKVMPNTNQMPNIQHIFCDAKAKDKNSVSSTLSSHASKKNKTQGSVNSHSSSSESYAKPHLKRSSKSDVSRTPKLQKITAPSYSTPEALHADMQRNSENSKNSEFKNRAGVKPSTSRVQNTGKEETADKVWGSKVTAKKGSCVEEKTDDVEDGITEQDSFQNISNGSECVPPTPPDEKSTFQSPKLSLRTPKRGKMSAVKNKKHSDGTKSSETSKMTSINEVKAQVRIGFEKEQSKDGEEILASSIVSQMSLTQDAINIIDVCSDEHLFEIFVEEWSNKTRYSLSVACEWMPKQEADVRIGKNFMKNNKCDNTASRRNDVDGFPIKERDIVIVGLAICWENRDAYYISLTSKPLDCDMNDSVAPPQHDKNVTIERRVNSLKQMLEKGSVGRKFVSITAFDFMSQYSALIMGCGIALKGTFEDPKVADWLTDPGARENNLHRLVTNCLPTHLDILEGIGGGIGVGSLGLSPKNPGTGRYRAVTECILSFHLMNYFRKSLKSNALYKSFTEVEMPAVLALGRMELNGFGFSHGESERQKNIMTAKLNALENQAYQLAGHPFSLSSADDISQILYIELKLPVNGDPNASHARTLGVNRRTAVQQRGRQKPQFSTNKEILEKLKQYHALPGVILEWRRISNALTKVVFPLQKESIYTSKLDMQRIYSECQTHTATGRVSLLEPNIQNTPKDFDISLPDLIGESPENNPNIIVAKRFTNKKMANSASKRLLMSESRQKAEVTGENKPQSFCVSMRHAFIPFKGGILLAADYSQLELRMIAYLSNDRKLMKILNGDGDVFKQIAAEWKNTSVEDVTAEWRQQAKQVCYGMIYGIGPKALGEQIGVDENDAVVFIETFKSKYPGMKKYLKETVDFCRENGYVKTMYGRKRFLPSIKDVNPHARAQAERQAVNTTVQGSAADLVKLAMIKIDKELQERFPECRFTHRHNFDQSCTRRRSCVKRPQTVPSGAYLVLQLHDELIYEVAEDNLVTVSEIIQRNMETAIRLPIKMPVKIKVGPSWGKLEESQL